MRPINQEKRPSDMVETLTMGALYTMIIGSPHYTAYERCIREGTEIPDHLLPGRLIMSCTPEQRALISQLTAKDFDHRPDAIGHFLRSK